MDRNRRNERKTTTPPSWKKNPLLISFLLTLQLSITNAKQSAHGLQSAFYRTLPLSLHKECSSERVDLYKLYNQSLHDSPTPRTSTMLTSFSTTTSCTKTLIDPPKNVAPYAPGTPTSPPKLHLTYTRVIL